jgi:chemotaxis protein CheD
MAADHHPLRQEAPPPVPGFQGIQRFWDPSVGHWMAKVLPGEYYVTCGNEAISTVLGSCVAACIRDVKAGLGGMNHFMLPEDHGTATQDGWLDPQTGLATRYGTHAMECLINELLKLGGRRERFEIKLFGAGRILASMTDVGARNAAFVHRYLQSEGFSVDAEDLGGIHPRRIIYFPVTGRVRVRRLRPLEATVVAQHERAYERNLAGESLGGDIELFD